jgi:GAF domain-containing protein
LLTDQRGALRVVAASTEESRLLELLQTQIDEAPCPDCFRTGEAIVVADLHSEAERWPRFAVAAVGSGFRSVHAAPMRLRSEVIGALNLFSRQPGLLEPATVRLGQALADATTIGCSRSGPSATGRHWPSSCRQRSTAGSS